MKQAQGTHSSEQLRGMTDTDLHLRLKDLRKELVDLRLEAQRKTLEQPHRIRQLRRYMARMLTVLQEKRTTPQEART